MAVVVGILSVVLGVINLVFWILTLIRLFQAGHTGAAIASIVLSLCGIGVVFAFFYGWSKADQLNARNLMYRWTPFFIIGCLIWFGGGILRRQIGL